MTGWQTFISLIVLAIVWHGCKLVLMTIRHRMNMAEIEARTAAQAERASIDAERASAEVERMRLMIEAQAERASIDAERAAAETERMRLMLEAITGRKAP